MLQEQAPQPGNDVSRMMLHYTARESVDNAKGLARFFDQRHSYGCDPFAAPDWS